MYFQKQEIVDKISEISQERHLHDEQLLQLQKLITNNKAYGVVEMREKFSHYVEELGNIIRQNDSVLQLLKYRCQKLAKEGSEVVTQLMRIQSLKGYFSEFKERLKRQQKRGEQIIAGRQRWQLTSQFGDTINGNLDEQSESLVHSANKTRQTVQMARQVYSNLTNQSGRLSSARQKMGEVLQNINLAGNIAHLLRTRTRQDNKLIMRFSVGLFVWTLICLYVLRPLVKGY